MGSEARAGPLAWATRVQIWDAALASVRACLREHGLREVSTPTRVDAVAIEPWIEPICIEPTYIEPIYIEPTYIEPTYIDATGASGAGASGAGAGTGGSGQLLATSPELAMKQLLARGGGPIFQIAHVFRAAERGAQHNEEFHLVEWYRDAPGSNRFDAVITDVERIVEAVFDAVAALELPGAPPRPRRWERVALTELMSETLSVELRGDEDARALAPILDRVRKAAGIRLAGGEPSASPAAPDPEPDPALDTLLAWTELFSLWSDLHLEPWLAARDQRVGVHVCRFPRALAALSEHEADGRTAARFESHVRAIELANGYRELRDPAEQRRRFALVARLRARHGQRALATPEAFLADLDRLPACAGAALGLDRLIALACGVGRLADVCLDPRVDAGG